MIARKAVRLGWINPPPTPTPSPLQQSQPVQLEPLAKAQLAEDRTEVAADGDT